LRNRPLRKILTTKETTTKETITKEKRLSDFLLFWDLYPNKKEKQAALKVWEKLNGSRPPIETILEAIKKQIEWRKNANGEFRPEWKHPATWLNKGCWDDELTITKLEAPKSIMFTCYKCHRVLPVNQQRDKTGDNCICQKCYDGPPPKPPDPDKNLEGIKSLTQIFR
jgi:hypothetical protein